MTHAFITWDAALGRRMCPLATFGSRAPLVQRTRLVCVDPPRADKPSLTNADDVRGAIALVVRGGCSFVAKARRLQHAGAVAMILANNTRDEPFEMFTMAADSEPTDHADAITIPCVMMCLYDVRELFKQFPPSVKTGVLTFEIHAPAREQELRVECDAARQLAIQQQQVKDAGGTDAESHSHSGNGSGSGWGAALKRTLIKRWEAPSMSTTVDSPRASSRSPSVSTVAVPTTDAVDASTTTSTTTETATASTAVAVAVAAEPRPTQPVFAFVQWAVNASEFVLFFAPLSDFCRVATNAVYEGARVVCDPLRADNETLRNGAALADAIALVARGACTFPAKLERIQRCGAAAAIVGNDDVDDEDAAFVMSVDHIKVDHVTIPAVMVSRRVFRRLVDEDCPAQLRILCLSGEATAECLARAGGQRLPIRDFPVADQDDDQADPTETATPLAQLHAACRASDHGACQRVLDESCDDERARRELVLARDKSQRTALHYACAADADVAGLEHVVALLLRLGAQPNARDIALNTPLHLACLRGHAASVKTLLTASIHGQELTAARNVGGATPLHYAAMAGSTVCVELLLSVNARRVEMDTDGHGGDRYCFDGVDARDVDGATPLHVACAAAQVDCVLYLVAASADLTVCDHAGRTPLQIACALVNEPMRSLQALHIVEKLMDAGAPVVIVGASAVDETETATLAIDCVASKAIKRELEVAFLRREALQTRAQFEQLTHRLDTQTTQMETLQQTLTLVQERHEAAQRVASERERRLVRQQKQMEQLQLQMKLLLSVLHSGDGLGLGHATTARLSTHDMLHAYVSDHDDNDDHHDDHNDSQDKRSSANDAARAQDAALARDLGRKCCRARQFALAQTYFERSLDVFPLPGVQRLLVETQALRREAEARPGNKAPAARSTGPVHDHNHDDGTRLRRMLLRETTASRRTKQALQREIEKLEMLDRRSSEYSASLKWIEWLLALPWASNEDKEGGEDSKDEATAGGRQPHRLLALEASMFDEIERMEHERVRRQQCDAAQTIQRAFREHYAVHLLQRAMASARIQRGYRIYRARREQQRCAALAVTRRRQRDRAMVDSVSDVTATTTTTTLEHDDENAETKDAERVEAPLDAATTVDAYVPLRGKRLRVIQGETRDADAQFVVLQLLATDSTKAQSRAIARSHDNAVTFYVWRRWGLTRADARQSTLCGPYEDASTATTRYERLRRESSTTVAAATERVDESCDGEKAVATAQNQPGTTVAATASAWTWLRASAS